MLLHQLEQSQRENVPIGSRLRDVAAALQTDEHAENLGNSTTQRPRDFALGESIPFMSQQLEDVETLLSAGVAYDAVRVPLDRCFMISLPFGTALRFLTPHPSQHRTTLILFANRE